MKILSRYFVLFITITVRLCFSTPPFELQSVRDGYRFQLNVSEPVLQKEAVNAVTEEGIRVNETFIRAYVYGFSFEGPEGDPALLSSTIEFAIENNPPDIEVTDVITQEIQLEGKLYPMQPPLYSYTGTTTRPFAYNRASYEPEKTLGKKSVSPEYITVTRTYTYRGQKTATITIRPLNYDVATNTITVVKQMTVNMKMNKPQVLHSWNSKAFDQVMRATYANLAYAAPEPFSAMEKYLIITMPEYKDDNALKEFVDYRSQQYDVKVVSIDDIETSTIDDFRAFVRNEQPTFCLLVGNRIPFWSNTLYKNYTYITATQISSANRKPMPDIALGLFYVDNSTQIANIVRKTIQTEKNLASRPKVVLAQGGNEERMGNLPPDHCDKIVKEVVSKYFLPYDDWTTYIYPTESPNEGARKAVSQFNEGCWFNIYNGHGQASGQSYGWGNRNLSSMKNTVYPFVLSCCCEAGSFDHNCVAAVSVGSSNGPVTMVAAYGMSFQGQHIVTQGYPDGIINKKITKSGLAYVYAVNYDSIPACYIDWAGFPSAMEQATAGWQFHHFGDPAIETMVSFPFVSITTPKQNDRIEQGKTSQIRWSSNIKGDVKVDLYRRGVLVSTLSAATPVNNGFIPWTPSGDEAVDSNYQIRVTSIDSSALRDTSGTFSIIPEYLLSAPYYQSFDTLDSGSMGLPVKYIQGDDTGDVLDWLVWQGPTPSRSGILSNTGPEGDNTSGEGKYLYIEASGNNSPGKKATFTTPNFNLSDKSYELSFRVHMFSSSNTMGTLSLDICVDGVWENRVLEVTGNQGDQWIERKLDLDTYKGDRVSFRFCGITGSDRASDICVDDIRVAVTSDTNATLLSENRQSYSKLVCIGSNIIVKIPETDIAEPMRIMLYNSRGQSVRCLHNGRISFGDHLFKLGKLARGLYFVTLNRGRIQKTYTVMIPK